VVACITVTKLGTSTTKAGNDDDDDEDGGGGSSNDGPIGSRPGQGAHGWVADATAVPAPVAVFFEKSGGRAATTTAAAKGGAGGKGNRPVGAL
jgi:hypothetical protein